MSHKVSLKSSSNLQSRVAMAGSSAPLPLKVKRIGFNRPLQAAQQDEQARYDAIFPTEIEPYYSAEMIAAAKISSQFLDQDEMIAPENRELIIRLPYDEGVSFEIANQDGSYLGFLTGLPDSELLIIEGSYAYKKALVVTLPDMGEADIYVATYQEESLRYIYAFSVPYSA